MRSCAADQMQLSMVIDMYMSELLYVSDAACLDNMSNSMFVMRVVIIDALLKMCQF